MVERDPLTGLSLNTGDCPITLLHGARTGTRLHMFEWQRNRVYAELGIWELAIPMVNRWADENRRRAKERRRAAP